MQEIKTNNIKIEDMIYEIRGVQVMLDSDLAMLYKCKNGTKSINLAVKRHLNRFPSRFMFQLTQNEYNTLRFQSETTIGNMSRSLPYAFTEQGIAMLATVLRTGVAEEVSIRIMDAFVNMRHFLIENKNLYKSINNINNKLIDHGEKIDYLFSKFDAKEKLFLERQEFTAYMNILEIINSAKKEIIVVDNYADISVLDLIRNIKCQVTLITKNSDRLTDIEIDKYNKEHNNLIVIRDNSFHDRYIVIDKKEIYHFGTSINNAGDKIFMIIKIEESDVKKLLLKIIDNVILSE